MINGVMMNSPESFAGSFIFFWICCVDGGTGEGNGGEGAHSVFRYF